MPVGPSPFSDGFSDWYSKKRHLKNKREFVGASGDMRRVKGSLTGDVYMLPKQDYDELVKHFNEHRSELSEEYKQSGKYAGVQTPADYIDFAFNSEAGKKNAVTQECQGGHIGELTYNPLYMLLMVKFVNRGDICVFFNLPANVASRLMYLAETNTMAPPSKDGKERHMVGVEFWNLVRVRGTVHDTRYPFQYTNDMRTGRAFGRRKGTGATGAGENKYDYYTAEPTYKRYDKETGEEIIRKSVVKRDLRSEQTIEQREQGKKLVESTRWADKADHVLEYDVDNLEQYFDGTGNYYSNHLNKASPVQRKYLLAARQMYDNADRDDKIVQTLRKTGLAFPPSRDLID